MLENASENPLIGEFVDKGKIFDPQSDRYAIDGTVLNLHGKMYFLWSRREGDEHTSQNIYIAPMSNPWTLGTEDWIVYHAARYPRAGWVRNVRTEKFAWQIVFSAQDLGK